MNQVRTTLKTTKIDGKDINYRAEVKSMIDCKLTIQQRVRIFFGSPMVIGTTTYFKHKVEQVTQTAGVTVGPWKKTRVLIFVIVVLTVISVLLFR